MFHRTLAVVCATAVSTLGQYQGEPATVVAAAAAAPWNFPAVRDIEVEPGPGSTLTVFLSAKRRGANHFDLIAGRWNLHTGQFTELGGLGLAALNTPADESSVTVSSDLLHLIYDTPTGPMLASRASVAAAFGLPRKLGNLPARPVNPCLLSDDVDPSKSWLLYEVQVGTDTDIWATGIDLTAAGTSVGNPGTVLSASAFMPFVLGPIIITFPSPGPGGDEKYTNVYKLKKNGTYKCRNVCFPGDTTLPPVTQSPEMTYHTGPTDVTGACQYNGTQFFANGTAEVQVLHLVSLTSGRVPQGGAQFDYPMFGPVRGVPGAGQQTAPGDLYLVLGSLLPSPIVLPAFPGKWALASVGIIGPVPNQGGAGVLNFNLPTGLPSGLTIATQCVYIDRSSPLLTGFGATGSLQSR